MQIKNEKKIVLRTLSSSLLFFGIALLPAAILAIAVGGGTLCLSMPLLAILCLVLGLGGRRIFAHAQVQVSQRIAFMSVLLTWLSMVLLTTLPIYFSGEGYRLVDALFESCAAWTTTGSSVIGTAAMPFPLQLLRATCSWISGLGIIVISIVVLPTWQFISRSMTNAEAPGAMFLMSSTTIRDVYTRILQIYLGLSLLQFLLLALAGLPIPEALLSSMSNMSTGGLTHLNNGMIGAYAVQIKIVLSIFAFLASLNASFLVLFFTGRLRMALRGSEFRLHLFRILLSALLIAGILCAAQGIGKHVLSTFGTSLMQVISYMSTAGFILSDIERWPEFCHVLIFIQLFIGACALSTGGGLKEARIIIAYRTMRNNLYQRVHPNSVRPIHYNGKVLSNDAIIRTNLYILLFMVTYLVGATLLSVDMDIRTAMTTAQAMLTNTGAGIGTVSDPSIIAGCSTFSRLVMCFLMLCGRLEIYPMLLLFSRSFWSGRSRENA